MPVNNFAFVIEAKLACHEPFLVNFCQDAGQAPCIRKARYVSFSPYQDPPHGANIAYPPNVRNG